MARVYLDEDVHPGIGQRLREKGHDVQTSNEAGNSNKSYPDNYQLKYATENDRVIVTNNRRDYNREHLNSLNHKGIVSGNHDKNLDRFAGQVDSVISNNKLENLNIRANNNDFVAENKVGERKTYTYDQPKIDLSHIQSQPEPAPAEPANPYRRTAPEPERKPDQPTNPYKRPGIEDDTGHSH